MRESDQRFGIDRNRLVKILMVAWYFPPTNTIAAVRLGKTAKYFHNAGHRIRVLSAQKLPFPENLPLELPATQVIRTPWWDINRILRAMKSILGDVRLSLTGPLRSTSPNKVSPDQVDSSPAILPPKRKRSRLIQLLDAALNFPDSRVGWMPPAYRAGRKLIRQERPDVIFASGPPFTTLLIGYLLSRRSNIPLVVEMRDRWSDDPYYPPPEFELKCHRWLEDKILGHARGITTVSEPWAMTYAERYRKPVEVVYNGFDPEDFVMPTGDGWMEKNTLRIVYTGGIYPGRRDPSPLFEAIGGHDDLKSRVKVDFFGTQSEYVLPLAERFGITNRVSVHPQITHAEALKEQSTSDVLLLMQWNDPKEQGNIPGKFFEYLAARRPILILGLEVGVPATIVRERGAGCCANTAATITDLLRGWIAQKKAHGFIAALPTQILSGFSRSEQVARFEAFLEEICFS